MKEQTKLIFENYGNTYAWETNHSDVTIEDCLSAFYGLMVGATFPSILVLNGMKEFAETHMGVVVKQTYNEREDIE